MTGHQLGAQFDPATTPRQHPDYLQQLWRSTAHLTSADFSPLAAPPGAKPRLSAVLMLFAGEGLDEAELLLTQRALQMRSHPGQVSFPGGVIDLGETATAAALREAAEETGLVADQVTVLGELAPIYLPPSNHLVTPVLAWWHAPGEVRVASPEEVHEVHQVSISELLDPARRFSVQGPLGWVGPGFWIGPSRDVLLWGFTAGVISRLFSQAGWAKPWDESVLVRLTDDLLGAQRKRGR